MFKNKLLAFLLLGILSIQVNGQSPHIIRNGLAQDIPQFSTSKEWVKEEVWVEAPFDSDLDGKADRLHVFVTRPFQTESKVLKLPIIYQSSPYYGLSIWNLLRQKSTQKFMWNVQHELGELPEATNKSVSKTRKKRPILAFVDDREWVPKGFITVYSSSPGTGLSDGVPTIGGENESLAPKAVIDWLCGRAKAYTTRDGNEEAFAYWSNDKIGMIGTSYDGTLALAAATTGVDGLEAIVPIAAVSSFYDYYRSNGLVRSPEGYLGEDADVLYSLIHTTKKSMQRSNNANMRDAVILKGIDRKTGDYNDFWEDRNYLKKLDKLNAAVLITHGFNDWNVMPEHSFNLYQALKQKEIPLQLYYHQDDHGGQKPDEMINKWFTKYLLEVENGVEDDAKVWIVPSNRNRAIPYKDFPHPDSKMVGLYLHKGNPVAGKLSMIQDEEVSIEKLVDDSSKKGAELATNPSNNRLLYLSPILKEDIHLSGVAKVSIELASNKPAANLSVWLVSLPWNEGDEAKVSDNIITRSWADPQNHQSVKGEPLIPGKFVNVSFNLQPDDQIIAKGQQIALMIFSSDAEFTILPKAGTELSIQLNKTRLFLPVVNGKSAMEKAFD